MNTEKFMSIKTGECVTCHDKKTLDSMIRHENTKGVYHCKDCEVIDNAKNYINDIFDVEISSTHESKLKKLFAWCFG